MADWRRLWRGESYSRAKLTRQLKLSVRWARRKLPPGVRLVAGIVLVICGCFGFLPILGFWMLPLGLVLVGLDIPPVHRRLVAWSEGAEAECATNGALNRRRGCHSMNRSDPPSD